MSNPFPGMNPYLERAAVWHDFHDTFCLILRRALLDRLGDRYDAAYDDHVWIVEPDEVSVRRADVHVTGEGGSSQPAVADDLTACAVIMEPHAEELREAFVEIRDRSDGRVVTVFELLSPTNKRSGANRQDYLAKRSAYLRSDTHLVELDFLRGGPRMPFGGLPECDYYAAVSVAAERPRARLWPLRLRDRLPTIPVPLAGDDPAIELDLQEVLDDALAFGGFDRRMYTGPPEPPLPTDDAAWAASLAPSRG